jgi:hypothetical protein
MRSMLAGFALALLLPAAASAQHPQTRGGFGISIGLGAGSASVSCEGCSDFGGTGLSDYLRLGGYVRPNLFLAGETNAWFADASNTGSDYIGAIMAVAQWYPNVQQGWYLKGGLGYAYSDLIGQVCPDYCYYSNVTPSGLGISLGTGYDLRVARNFALTPYLNYLRIVGGSADSYPDSPGVGAGLFQFGLGFTWF